MRVVAQLPIVKPIKISHNTHRSPTTRDIARNDVFAPIVVSATAVNVRIVIIIAEAIACAKLLLEDIVCVGVLSAATCALAPTPLPTAEIGAGGIAGDGNISLLNGILSKRGHAAAPFKTHATMQPQ